MPTKCYKYISMSLLLLLCNPALRKKKNAAALVTQQIRLRSQTRLQGTGAGLLPLSEENGALASPRRSVEAQTR